MVVRSVGDMATTDALPGDLFDDEAREVIAGLFDPGERVLRVLDEMQAGLLARALEFRARHMRPIGDAAELAAFFTPKNPEKPEIHGGFAVSPWCGDAACENRVKESLKVTIRCIPIDEVPDGGFDRCVVCGAPRRETAVFAKNY